ncbi:hypothetical protein [Fructobacillus parabroussonetiae]|nr:hypothetical protein [Fructobacillus parabroussonetiae]
MSNNRPENEEEIILKRELSGYKVALWTTAYILGVVTSVLLVK